MQQTLELDKTMAKTQTTEADLFVDLSCKEFIDAVKEATIKDRKNVSFQSRNHQLVRLLTCAGRIGGRLVAGPCGPETMRQFKELDLEELVSICVVAMRMATEDDPK